MIQPLRKGLNSSNIMYIEVMTFWIYSCSSCLFVSFYIIYSYLKTLLDPFNEIVNAFIEELRPTADGVETVLMKIKFGEFTLNVMSKVSLFLCLFFFKSLPINVKSVYYSLVACSS